MNSKDFWLSKNLTERAAIVLADMGIDTFEDLVGSIINEDLLRRNRNCAEGTSREIINFRRKLLPVTDTSSKKINRRAVEILKKISVNEIPWDARTRPLIRESGAKNVYDLAMIHLPVYQGFNHYNLRAYHKIKSRVFHILTEINASFSRAHEEEEISLNIFVEKPNGQLEKIQNKENNDEVVAKNISLLVVAGRLLKTLTPEEVHVVKLYYGFNYRPRAVNEIATLLQLSLQEVQDIQEQARLKVQHPDRLKVLQQLIKFLYRPHIMKILQKNDNKMALNDLKKAVLSRTIHSHKERAISYWFEDMLGSSWFSLGSQKYHSDSTHCYLV
jgi:Sigma-70, region 4